MFGEKFALIVVFSVIVAGAVSVFGISNIKAGTEAEIAVQQIETAKAQITAEMAKPAVSDQATTTMVVESPVVPVNEISKAISEGNDNADDTVQELLSPSYIYVAPAMVKAMSSGQE